MSFLRGGAPALARSRFELRGGVSASSYCFNYLLFLLRDQYGFSDRGNLLVSARHGAVYCRGRVPHVVGLYNATWSGFAAVADFTGGPLDCHGVAGWSHPWPMAV